MSSDNLGTGINLDLLLSLNDSELQDFLASRPQEEQVRILDLLMNPPAPKEVLRTRAEVAARFGVDIQTVSNWCGKPDFPGKPGDPLTGAGGYFPVKEIDEWRQGRLRSAGRIDDGEQTWTTQIAAERLRKLKLENDETAGRLIDAEVVERLMARAFAMSKQILCQLQFDLPTLLPKKTTKALKAEFVAAIKQKLDQAFEHVAAEIRTLDEELKRPQESNGSPSQSS